MIMCPVADGADNQTMTPCALAVPRSRSRSGLEGVEGKQRPIRWKTTYYSSTI